MTLTYEELEFLAAWAREEWEPACYQLPAHRLQLTHGVAGGQLLEFIKWWTASEGKKDQDILEVAATSQPRWPWSTSEEFEGRLAAARLWRTHPDRLKRAAGVEVI